MQCKLRDRLHLVLVEVVLVWAPQHRVWLAWRFGCDGIWCEGDIGILFAVGDGGI